MKAFLQKHYPLILLILSALILLIRAFYGFCWSDETFYYSIAYRFLQGDAPFFEEWYPTQLNSIFLMPFVALYRLIAGSNDGIILTFRILYVLVSFLIAWQLFRVMEKETTKWGATVTALLFFYYTHLNILTFSYYAVSALAAVLSMLLILKYRQDLKSGKKAMRYLVFSGIAFSVFILSMPSMILYYIAAVAVFVILILLSIIKPIKGSFRSAIRDLHLVRFFLYHLLGICIVAIPFSIYFFTHVSLTDFLNSVIYVLTDEEHVPTTAYVTFKTCFTNLSKAYGIFAYISYVCIAVSIILFLLSLTKAAKKHEGLLNAAGLAVFVLDLACYIGLFVKGSGHTGYVQVSLVLFFLPLFFLLKKPPFHLFVTFVILGGCMAFSYTHTSSGHPLYTGSIGFAVAGTVAVPVILQYVKQTSSFLNKTPKQLLQIACCTVILSALFMTMTLRMINIYRDDVPGNLTERIPDGPAAGILTSKQHLTDYESVLSTLRTYCNTSAYPDGEHRLLLITKLLPWGYLCSDMQCASPYSWRTGISSDRLELYYNVHPDKYPDVVLVLNENIGSYEACGDVEKDPNPNADERGGMLDQYMLEHDYTEKSVPCGTLYIRP